MITIFKYPFDTAWKISIPMPVGAKILKLAMQGPTPCIWAQVDTDSPVTTHHFRIVGTGREIPPDELDNEYIDTYMEGPGVWHLFRIQGVRS